MEAEKRHKYEMILARCHEVRFLSHLDFMRAISRMLRRTGLPIYFSEGFNPKPKVSYMTPPLSTGHTSECERVIFSLMRQMDLSDVSNKIEKMLPHGYKLIELNVIEENQPKATAPDAVEYYVFVRKGAERYEFPQDAERTEVAGKILMRVPTIEERMGLKIFSEMNVTEDFLGEFSECHVFLLPSGAEFKKPEAAVCPELRCGKEDLYFHRMQEKSGIFT
ncbi:MAG TPA: TIGR03936 family radical SAM-associated protein [bacterium]|nr:TIGR03936 family radical SAM-associated protein [bacterium]